MLCFYNHSLNPYFNIATEEYLLKNYSDNIILFYRNAPSLIIGKHQNTLAEINYPLVWKNQIPVVRRISGGGTVYHDCGNINFSFILNGEKGKLVDFKKYTAPIIKLLNQQNIPAKLGARNNIFINNKKISGNAEHIYKSRVLHHGTLLYSSNLNYLNNYLKTNNKYSDKAVKSVPASVTNISEHLNHNVNITKFISNIIRYFKNDYNVQIKTLDTKEKEIIWKSCDDKYQKWDWNFAYSPDFKFRNIYKNKEKSIEIETNISKGIIKSISLNGDLISDNKKGVIAQKLINKQYHPQQILAFKNIFNLSEYELLQLFF